MPVHTYKGQNTHMFLWSCLFFNQYNIHYVLDLIKLVTFYDYRINYFLVLVYLAFFFTLVSTWADTLST